MKILFRKGPLDFCVWDFTWLGVFTFKERYSSRHQNFKYFYLLVTTKTENWRSWSFKNCFINDCALRNSSWDTSLSLARTNSASSLWFQNWYLGGGMRAISFSDVWTTILRGKLDYFREQYCALKAEINAKCLFIKIFKFCWKITQQETRWLTNIKRSPCNDTYFH